MFTRTPPAEPRPLDPRSTRRNGPQPSVTAPSSGEKSIIGNDLKIIGQGLRIIGRGQLEVDGEIEGDVHAADVIVGEKGQVSGNGRGPTRRRTWQGLRLICAQTVALQAASQVDGDTHHMSFAIEQGAQFDGRSRRANSEADLVTVLEERVAPTSAE